MATLTPLSFGALLKHRRRRADMTQEDLAEAAGYSVSYISMLERGERTPQASAVELFAEALHATDVERAELLAARDHAEAPAHLDARPLRDRPVLVVAPGVAGSDADTRPDVRDGVALRTVLVASLRGPLRLRAQPIAGSTRSAPGMPPAVAERFAALARACVAPYGGQLGVTGGAGMGVVASFATAHQAVRAALALQSRCAQERQGDPAWPWQVGIGLDALAASEDQEDQAALGDQPTAPVNSASSRGTALPALSALAQRLCTLAGPDEILASERVAELAPFAGAGTYVDRGRLQRVGLAAPERVLQVSAASGASAGTAAHQHAAAPPAMPLGGFLGMLPEGPLVAREPELERIRLALDAVLGGAGQLVMLSGEPGVGKTRLAQEVTRAARNRGMLVAVGRCYLPQQAVAYYPFLDVLAMLHACAPDALRAQVPERWAELGRLLPDLPASPGAALTPASRDDQQRLHWQVAGFIQAMAEQQPVALLLDDLQWADRSSLDLLLHLAHQTRAARVFVLGIHRDSELPTHAPLQAALRELVHEHLVERIAIAPLALEGTAALLAACLGLAEITPELAAHIHEPTEGNAFFVQEVVRALIERGDLYRHDEQWQRRAVEEIVVPESVRATIDERVARLAAPTQSLLRAASVLGQAFSFDDLWRMEERDEDEVEGGLTEATLAGLVRETGDEAYRFSHALTRRALADGLSARQTRRLHLAAGMAIERLSERTRTRRAAELARHFLAGDAPERALPYLLAAGDQAEVVYAHAEAERHYRSAVEVAHALGDRIHEAAAAEKLADILATLGHTDESVVLRQQALTAFRELGDVEGQRRTSAGLAATFTWRPNSDGAAAPWALLTPLLRDAEQAPASPGVLELYDAASVLHTKEGRHELAVAAAEKMLAVAQALGDPQSVARAQLHLAAKLRTVGRDDEALRALSATLDCLEGTGDLRTQAVALTWVAEIRMRQGYLAECEGDLLRACELAVRFGRPGTQIHTLVCLGQWAFWAGDWPRARQCLERVEALYRRSEFDDAWRTFWHAHAPALLGLQAVAQQPAQGVATLEAAVAAVAALPGEGADKAESLQIGNGALAECELVRGDASAAHARLVRLLGTVSGHPGAVAALRPLLAWAALQQGDVVEAGEALDLSLSYLRAGDLQLALVDALRIQALLAIQQRQWRRAEAALAEAITRAHAMPYPYAEAKGLYVRGLLHLARKPSTLAREAFDAALAILARLGERVYAGEIERVLATLSASEVTPE